MEDREEMEELTGMTQCPECGPSPEPAIEDAYGGMALRCMECGHIFGGEWED